MKSRFTRKTDGTFAFTVGGNISDAIDDAFKIATSEVGVLYCPFVFDFNGVSVSIDSHCPYCGKEVRTCVVYNRKAGKFRVVVGCVDHSIKFEFDLPAETPWPDVAKLAIDTFCRPSYLLDGKCLVTVEDAQTALEGLEVAYGDADNQFKIDEDLWSVEGLAYNAIFTAINEAKAVEG